MDALAANEPRFGGGRAYRICVALVLATLTACFGGATQHVLATVLSVQGAASWAAKNSSEFRPLGTTANPGAGSILRTADGATVNMALFPGALLQIHRNTDLQVEQLTLTKDGNETDDGMGERVARLKLAEGSILNLLDPAARFTIVTPGAMIDVTPGCLFLLQTDKKKTRLTCVRGKIHVTPRNRTELAVEAGYVLEWTDSGAAVVPAAPDAAAQVDTSEALRAEQQLRELQLRQSTQVPFLPITR